MTVATTKNQKSRAASKVLNEMSAETGPNEKTPDDSDDLQILHGAKNEAENILKVDPEPANPVDDGEASLLELKISELLEEISEGLKADDSTNFEKLSIARKYGPLLCDLKALAPHGEFMNLLKERFPKVNYAKCNRWMFIAKHELEVVAAIENYPDVAWGPKKMIDYLKEFWIPEEEGDDDEDDCSGYVRDEFVKDEPLLPSENDTDGIAEPEASSPFAVGAFNPFLANAVEQNHQWQDNVPPGETAGPVTQAVRTNPRPGRNAPANRPANNGTRIRPTANQTDYEVEVRIGFKLSVPANVTAEEIAVALQDVEAWSLAIETPFGYQMSEKGVVVNHVRPWDALDQFQPEPVPQVEAVAE